MKNRYGNVVMVTGASSGIGKALALALMEQGYRVYGTSRRAGQNVNENLKAKTGPGFLRMIKLDVCSDESVRQAVEGVISQEGTLDILINNAGFGIAGAVEDTTSQDAFRQMDTNFFGVHRMCREVIPLMRKKGNGLIINVSSVAGLISIPYQAMYSASKYALEAYTEAMGMELRPFGIRVSLVEPGDTSTGFTDSRQYVKDAGEGSVYQERFTKSLKAMEKSEKNGPAPEKVVKTVVSVIHRKNPPVRCAVGFSYKAIVFLKRLVPNRLVQFGVSKLY